MVHLNFDAHDTLESMALCINSFDIRDNGTWFSAAIYVHGHRSYSNRNYNLMPAPVESLDNVVNDSPMKSHAINAVGKWKFSGTKSVFIRFQIMKLNYKPGVRKLNVAALRIGLASVIVMLMDQMDR